MRKPTSFISTVSDERGEELRYGDVPLSAVFEREMGHEWRDRIEDRYQWEWLRKHDAAEITARTNGPAPKPRAQAPKHGTPAGKLPLRRKDKSKEATREKQRYAT